MDKIEAVRQLAALGDGERARRFIELIPEIENDDDLLELTGLLMTGNAESISLVGLLISLITYKRKMEMDFAKEFGLPWSKPRDSDIAKRFSWCSHEKKAPSVDDVINRQQFRAALVAIARSIMH